MPQLRFEPIEGLVERCLRVSPDAPIVFFVGSGVSTVYPSVLPSAWEMISETAGVVAPTPTPGLERELAREIRRLAEALPEIYYEILRDVIGDEAIRAWEALRFWQDHPDLQQFNLGPNPGHLALVYLAWQGRTPLITTNFDTLLEEAARSLSLEPLACIPIPPDLRPPDHEQLRTAQRDNEVAIWKVHGTVEPTNFDSIHTTLRTITQADWRKLERIRQQFEQIGTTVCFMGYSGSDLDLFPHMAGWRLHHRIYWLGPSFSRRHMIHRNPDQFTAVVGTSERFATLLAGQWKIEDARIGLLRDRLRESDAARDRALAGRVHARERYLAAVRQHLKGLFTRILPPADPRRLLIHARALTSIGQNRRAWPYVVRFTTAAASVPPHRMDAGLVSGALTLKASLAHEFSQYEDSFAFSEQARRIACRHGLRAVTVEATMAADEALRMQHLPGLRFKEKSYLLHPRAWIVVVRFLLHAFVFGIRRWQDLPRRLGQNTVHAESVYLEHLVRIGAIFQELLAGYRLEGMAKVLMTWLWSYVEVRSYEIGYAHGIGNARKYGERLGIPPRTTAALQAGGVYELLSAQTGKAIAYRDHGRRLAREYRVHEAVRAYNRAYRIALIAGNISLALKALIDRRLIQPDFKPDRALVQRMLKMIQGAAYRRIEASMLDWLCGASHRPRRD